MAQRQPRVPATRKPAKPKPKPNRLRVHRIDVQVHLIEETAAGKIVGDYVIATQQDAPLRDGGELHTFADELPAMIRNSERELVKKQTTET